MAENDKKCQNSQSQTDSQIKANKKNKYKIPQVIEIINSVEKLERTIRQFNTQATVDICEDVAIVITLPCQINSLFKYVHTSFRQVKSDPTIEATFPLMIDHRAVTPCREMESYWSNPTWCFFPILCALPIQASRISRSKLLNNSLHLSNKSSEVSESSPSTSNILRQSLLSYCSKSSHFLNRREDTVLETSNEFSDSMTDSSSLSILSES